MKILIVDDEAISRKILSRKMAPLGECLCVDDGLKALKLFDEGIKTKAAFDLITLDVSMPKMDGQQLLSMIRKKEKALGKTKKDRVKIIMISARMNVSTIKACIKLGCDGYITKPVSKDQLLETLERIGFEPPADFCKKSGEFQDIIVANIIKRFYEGEIKLPILPRIVNEIRDLKENPDASIDDLVDILKNDIAISARMISVANSALYKGLERSETLNGALVRLGMKTSCDLIFTIVTRDLFKSENEELQDLLERLWLHSFACGAIGKQLAQVMGIANADAILLMGITHDIGKMFLIKAVVDVCPEETFEEMGMELAIHEIHTTFGAVLLKKMKFSKEFVHIAEFHHWNDFPKEADKALLIIHLSDYLAREIGFYFFNTEPHEKKQRFDDLENLASFRQLGLDADQVMKMAVSVKDLIASSSSAF